MASAVLVGVAGAVYGYYVSFLDTSAMFDIALAIEVVLAALLGGRGTVWGPVLGAFLLQPLIELTNSSLGGQDAGAIRLLLFGGLLLAVALLLPRGLLPRARAARPRRRRRGDASPTGRAPGGRRAAGLPARLARRGATRRAPPLLRVTGLSKRFGGVHGARRGDLRRARGVDHRADRAQRLGQDDRLQRDRRHLHARRRAASSWTARRSPTGAARGARSPGIGRTYQLPRLFDSLTVLENVAAVTGELRLAARSAAARSRARRAARATELLEFVGLGEYVDARATDLSYGQRKLVELAQVLMLDPAVILLDEPAAGHQPDARASGSPA